MVVVVLQSSSKGREATVYTCRRVSLGMIEVRDYGVGEYAAGIKFGGLLFAQEGALVI